jgi:hypothetical protein
MAGPDRRTPVEQTAKDLIDRVVDEAAERVRRATGATTSWRPSAATRRALTEDTRLSRILLGIGADDRRLAADEIFDGTAQSPTQAIANLGRWSATPRDADDVRRLLRTRIADIVAESGARDPAAVDDRIRLVAAAVALDAAVAPDEIDPVLAALARAALDIETDARPFPAVPAVVDVLARCERAAEAVLVGTRALSSVMDPANPYTTVSRHATVVADVAAATLAADPQPELGGAGGREALEALVDGLLRVCALTTPIEEDPPGEADLWRRLDLPPVRGALGVAATLAELGATERLTRFAAEDRVKVWILDALYRSMTAEPLRAPWALAQALMGRATPIEELSIALTGLWVALVQTEEPGQIVTVPGVAVCLAVLDALAEDADRAAELPVDPAAITAAARAPEPDGRSTRSRPSSGPTFPELLDSAMADLDLLPRRGRPGRPSDAPLPVTDALTRLAARVIGPGYGRHAHDVVAHAREMAESRTGERFDGAVETARRLLPEPTKVGARRIVRQSVADHFDAWVAGAETDLAAVLRRLPLPLSDRRVQDPLSEEPAPDLGPEPDGSAS